MDSFVPFLTERWYVVLIALLLLFWLVRKVVGLALKLALVLGVLALIVFYGANYSERLRQFGRHASSVVATEVQDEALRAFRNEFQDARYKSSPDGTFLVETRSLQIAGITGAREAKVKFRNHTFDIKMDDAWNALVEQVRQRR